MFAPAPRVPVLLRALRRRPSPRSRRVRHLSQKSLPIARASHGVGAVGRRCGGGGRGRGRAQHAAGDQPRHKWGEPLGRIGIAVKNEEVRSRRDAGSSQAVLRLPQRRAPVHQAEAVRPEHRAARGGGDAERRDLEPDISAARVARAVPVASQGRSQLTRHGTR